MRVCPQRTCSQCHNELLGVARACSACLQRQWAEIRQIDKPANQPAGRFAHINHAGNTGSCDVRIDAIRTWRIKPARGDVDAAHRPGDVIDLAGQRHARFALPGDSRRNVYAVELKGIYLDM